MRKHSMPQRSPEWLQIKKGKISGTFLKSIMGTPKARQEAIWEFIAEKLTVGVELEYENAMDRGTRLEVDAVAMFEIESGKQVDIIGFCENEDEPAIANSPDGYIAGSDDTEAVEVKCLGGKNHVKMWLLNQVPEDYDWQVVQYFVVNPRLEKLYFVGYNPDIPRHPLHIIELRREEIQDRIDRAKEAQLKFLADANEILNKIIDF